MNPFGAILLATAHFSRVYVFCALLPPIKSALGQVGILALSMALAVYFVASAAEQSETVAAMSGLQLGVVYLGYLLSGGLVAIPLAFAFEALALGGRLVDLGRGAQLSEQFDPAAAERSSAVETLLKLLAPVFAFKLGLQFQVLSLLNFRLIPGDVHLLEMLLSTSMQDALIRLACETVLKGLLFAAPIMLCCFLVDLALAFASRFLPRVSISFEVLPLKLLLGLAVLLLLGSHGLLNTGTLEESSKFLQVHLSWMGEHGR